MVIFFSTWFWKKLLTYFNATWKSQNFKMIELQKSYVGFCPLLLPYPTEFSCLCCRFVVDSRADALAYDWIAAGKNLYGFSFGKCFPSVSNDLPKNIFAHIVVWRKEHTDRQTEKRGGGEETKSWLVFICMQKNISYSVICVRERVREKRRNLYNMSVYPCNCKTTDAYANNARKYGQLSIILLPFYSKTV